MGVLSLVFFMCMI